MDLDTLATTLRHTAAGAPPAWPEQRLLKAVIAAARAVGATSTEARTAALRTGMPRLADAAYSKRHWEAAWAGSLETLPQVAAPGTVADTADRDRAALSAVRRLVAGLALLPARLPSRHGMPTAAAALALIGLAEVDIARERGWKSALISSQQIATDLGLTSNASGINLMKKLRDSKAVIRGRKPRGGQAYLYHLPRLPAGAWASDGEAAGTIAAVAAGGPTSDVLAGLIMSVAEPGWFYGAAAPGRTVWLGCLKLAGMPIDVPQSTRTLAREWLAENELAVADVAGFVAELSTRADAIAERAALVARRQAAADDVKERMRRRGILLREAGKLSRAAAKAAAGDRAGKGRHVSSLAPKPHRGSGELGQWLGKYTQVVLKAKPPEELVHFIVKDLRTGLELAGWTEAQAAKASEKVGGVLAGRAGANVADEVVAETAPAVVPLSAPLPY